MTAYKKNSSYKMHELPVVTRPDTNANIFFNFYTSHFAVLACA